MPRHSESRAVGHRAVVIAALAALTTAVGVAAEDKPDRMSVATVAEAESPVSPLIVTQVPQAAIVPVKGSDGRTHVLYELLLVNTLASPADLRRVEVLDAASGKSLLALDEAAIVKGEYLHGLDRKSAEATTFAPFTGRTLLLNLAFDGKAAIPRKVVTRFEVSGLDPFTSDPTTFDYRGGEVEISDADPPVLSAPLEGDGWLASDGCCGPTGHVSALIGLDGRLQASERFAIDWIKTDKDGHVFNGDKSKPANWVGFGAKVLAVAPGVVTVASNGMQEHDAGAMPDKLAFAQHPGNSVALALDNGFTAVYAHLQPGSIRVKVGDRVKVGQVLGLLGNTGGSLAPHLHFHIVNGANGFTSDGYPYVLRSFALRGQADPALLTQVLAGKASFPHGREKPAAHKDELPLNFNIVDFPK
jgi:hypothetical protein